MHRIDTPTAQADKFGPGKNGFINGDPATGRRATDLNSDMWDAVQEEICTAIESAGLTLDKTKHDQLYKAIVKIITSKIPDALLRQNNLSDVVDKALARANLELGTAAIRNTADNSNNNALVPVGYKGNFTADSNHGAIDFATYPFVVGESLFIDARGCTNKPPFLMQDYYYIDVVCATGPAQGGRVNRPLIQFVSYTSSTLIFAIREDDGNTLGWRYFRAVQYDADNTNITIPGGLKAFNGASELTQNAVVIRANGNKHLYFFNTANKEVGLVYASDDQVLHLRAGGGPSLNIGPDGSITAPGYFGAGDDIHSGRNISSVGLIQAGTGVYDTPGVRVYSPNNPPPKVAYTPAESDARYQFKGSYAAPNTAGLNGAALWWRCGSTGKLTMAAYVAGVPNGGRVYFPTAFPNYCTSVVANQNSDTGSGGAAMQPYGTDTTGFNLRIPGGGTVNLMYIAEGY